MNAAECALLERSRARLERARTAVENQRRQAVAELRPIRESVQALPESIGQQVKPRLAELAEALRSAFAEMDLPLGREVLRITDALSTPSLVTKPGPAATPQRAPAGTSLDRQIIAALGHPDLATVMGKLLEDRAHAVDVVQSLRAPDQRSDALQILDELTSHDVLDQRPFAEYVRYVHGRGPLFAQPRDEVHHLRGGEQRIDAFVTHVQQVDPVRAVCAAPSGIIDETALEWVRDYARRLRVDVQPVVESEAGELATAIPSATLSARTKTQRGIVAKVTRRAQDNVLRRGDPSFSVGHVLDAVAARIVVGDTQELESAYHAAMTRFGVGADGRVLSVEDMYSTPRPYKPALRVITLNCTTVVGGTPYPFELQLSTRRAQISADLDHNVVYKPYLQTTPGERNLVGRMLQTAAVLDLEETRSNHRGA